jgi:hypothetical protein
MPEQQAVAPTGMVLMSTLPLTLAEVVTQRVLNRTGRRVHDLSVEVGRGSVILRGRAASYHVKQLAQHGAREAMPNATLENAIVVE